MLSKVLVTLVTMIVTFSTFYLSPAQATYDGPDFDWYPGICTAQTLEAPALKPNTWYWSYRTRIMEGTINTCVNFGGSFTLVSWGCPEDDNCVMGVLVDRTNGDMYPLPKAGIGYEYRADSVLLIVVHRDSIEYRVFYHGRFLKIAEDNI